MLITSQNIQELLVYLKGENPTLNIYSKVRFKHDKKTNGNEIITTFGRVLFNALLPEDYPFVNEEVDRSKLNKIIKDIFFKYDKKTYKETVNKLQKYLLFLSTIAPATIDVSKLDLPNEIRKLKEELLNKADSLDNVEFDKEIDRIYSEFEKYLKSAHFFDLVKSKTKGKKSDLEQLFISWGSVYDPINDKIEMKVKHSLLDGLDAEEMYYGANKARLSAYMKSEYSAKPGYLARKLRFALSTLKLSNIDDCKTDKYFEFKVTEDNYKTILGRYYFDDKKRALVKIDENNIKDLIGKYIKLRSPLYCKAPDGICKKCIGDIINNWNTTEIGLTTSGILYNKSLNYAMKHSHQKVSSQDYVNFIEEFKKYYV